MMQTLPRYKYPPDKQPEATEKVIAQVELLADTWVREDCWVQMLYWIRPTILEGD